MGRQQAELGLLGDELPHHFSNTVTQLSGWFEE